MKETNVHVEQLTPEQAEDLKRALVAAPPGGEGLRADITKTISDTLILCYRSEFEDLDFQIVAAERAVERANAKLDALRAHREALAQDLRTRAGAAADVVALHVASHQLGVKR